MSGPSSPREHLSALVSFLPRALRAAWVGGIALALGLVATTAFVLSTARRYRSEAVVVYEHGVQSASAASGDPNTLRNIGSRIQDMLASRQRLESLIKEMKLYERIVEQRGLQEAVDEMRKYLIVANHGGNTFRISYDAESRDLAKNVLDRLLKAMLEEDTRQREREVNEAKKFLDTERARADEDLRAKESALAAFLAEHPQLAAEAAGGGAAAGGIIRAADRAQAAASSGGGDIAALELQAAQIEESLASAASAPRIPGDPTSAPAESSAEAARARAHAELAAAQKDLLERQTRFTNEHPDVKQAVRRVAAAEAAVRKADAAAATAPSGATPAATGAANPGQSARVAALHNALSAVRAQIASVKSRAAPRVEMPRQVSSVVAIDTEFTRLSRGVTEARGRVDQIEAKQFQAELTATLVTGGLAGQLSIADPPFRPMRPVAGARFKVALFGAAASLMFGLLIVGLFAAFDDRFYTPADVERVLHDGIVVVIPKVPPKATEKTSG